MQQMLVLMLQEAVAGEGSPLKEKFLEASELKRYEVSQAICSQEGVRERLQYESQLKHFEKFFSERERYGAPERLKVKRSPEEEQKRSGLQSDLYTLRRLLKRGPLELSLIHI